MRSIADLSIYYKLDPSEIANSTLSCPECGREHSIPFKIVRAGEDLVEGVPAVIREILNHDPALVGLVFDRHIQEKIEDLVITPLTEIGLPIYQLPLGKRGHLLSAEITLGNEAVDSVPEGVEMLLGVGSGVISDLTKWIATKLNLPFVLLGTAASMNAYTSITGSMTENQIKTSKWLNPADAVLLDSNLLASAPVEMTCAGIGDLLARDVANADWKLSQILRGTYFCRVPYQMMEPYEEEYLPLVERLGKNDPQALTALAKAILVSGYSMTILNGETSPSSGSEHIISHFFDFQHELFDLPKNLHGTQVGLGTIIMLTGYEMLRELNPTSFDLDEIERRRISQTAVKLDHQRVFGEKGKLLDEVAEKKRISDLDYRNYVKNILESWEAIWKALDPFLLPSQTVRRALQSAGAITTLAGVNRNREDAVQALLYGSRYRSRYTVLDLFWELGLFPDLAPEILDRSGVLE